MMFDNQENSTLSDLIDIKFLQEFQDIFAKTMDVASLIYDKNGPVTKPSNFTDFCTKYTRGSTLGLKRCVECDIKWGKLASVKGEPVIYNCHTGLTDFAVPIVVEGQHIGTIFGGQILIEPPDEVHFRKIARELEIDEDEYIEALKKIKIVPIEKVMAAANLLYFVANAISEIGRQNNELVKRSLRATLYKSITETIRNSLDIVETKKMICDIIGKTLRADRCFIVEYDKENDEFLPIQDEYLSSDKITPYLGTDINKDVPAFAAALKKGKPIIINNKEIALEGENQNFDLEKKAIEKQNVKSAIGFPLYYSGELLGILAVHYVVKQEKIGEDEINLISLIANQVAMALRQSKLYNTVQKIAENERILRQIMLSSVITLEMKDAINSIVTEAGKLFKADRCFFVEYNPETNYAKPINEYAEYLSSEDIRSHTTRPPGKAETEAFMELTKQKKTVVVEDIWKIDLPKETKIMLVDDLAVKSYLISPVYYGDIIYGSIVLHYVNNFKQFDKDEINMAQAIANQSAIVIHHAKLYQQMKSQAERESLYRNIMQTIRGSLDIVGLKKQICDIIGETLNADRCFIAEYDDTIGKFLIVQDEYLSSDKIVPFKGADPNVVVPTFAEALKNGDHLIINDKKICLKSESQDFGLEQEAIDKYHVNSAYAFPLFYSGEFLGVFSIHYVNKKYSISEAETELMDIFANQIAIAIKQARLFKINKDQAEREVLLRNIIETIRSSIEIDKTLSFICDETAKLFNVQRTSISQFPDSSNYEKFIIRKESKVSPSYGGIADLKYISKISLYFGGKLLKKGEVVAINNISESDAPDYFKESYNHLGVKSIMVIPIQKKDDKWGVLVLSEYTNYRVWSEDEIELAKSIASQIYIAIKQAELYDKEKKALEREKLHRSIVETIRSTIDINELFELICTEIANIYNVQRAFIVELDKYDGHKEFKTRKEFKKTSKIRGFNDKAFDMRTIEYWGKVILDKGGKIIIDNIPESDAPDYFKDSYKNIGVKSIMGIPIKMGDANWGWIGVSEYNYYRHWSDDDVNLLETISSQIYIAIKQAELYKQTQENVEREKLSRELISAVSSTLDFNEIKKMLVNKLGTALGSDMDIIYTQDMATRKFLPVDEYSVHLSSAEIESPVGVNIMEEYGWADFFRDEKRPDLFYSNIEDFIKDYNLYGTKGEEFINRYKIKSTIVVQIKSDGILHGFLAINFTKNHRIITENDVNLVKTVATQAEIAIHQAELYNVLKQNTANQNAILNNMPFMAWLKDEQSRLLAVNEEFAKMCDCPVKDIIGKTDFDFFPREHAESYVREDRLVMEARHAIPTVDLIKGPEGVRWHETIKSPVFDDRGNVVGTVGLSRDITEKKEAELELLRRQEQIIKAAEREKILRKTVETIRSSMDINFVKHEMIWQIGVFLNADRVAFADYDFTKENYIILSENEYRSSSKVKTFVGYDFSLLPGFVENIRKVHLGGNDIIFSDLDKYLEANNLKGSETEDFYREMGFMSSMAINVNHGDLFYGNLVITFEQKREINEDDIKFIRTLADQAGIAIYQTSLYEKEKNATAREKLIGSILTKAISTFDINQIKQIVNDVGILTKADRCYFVEIDLEKMKGKLIEYEGEYLASPDIVSIIGYDFPTEDVQEFIQIFLDVKDIVVFDFEKIQQEHDEYYAGMKRYCNRFKLKNSIAIPFYYREQLTAVLVIEYVKEKMLPSADDLDFLRILGNQAGMAYSQIKLFQNTKKTAERESLLREVIETIRSSIDLNQTLTIICERVAKLFKVQRVSVIEFFNKNDFNYWAIRREYKERKDVLGLDDIDYDRRAGAYNGQMIMQEGKYLVIDNINEFDAPDYYKKTYQSMGIKSILSAPIESGEDKFGIIFLSSTDEYRHWLEEEIQLLDSVASQIYVAIRQAELFDYQKKTADRETVLRKITEIIRSTLDLNETFQNISKEISTLFEAERVIIIEFPNKQDLNEWSIKFDYVNSPDMITSKNAPLHQDTGKEWGNFIFNSAAGWAVDDVQKANISDALMDNALMLGIQSLTGTAIKNENEVWGTLTVASGKPRHWTSDEIDLLNTISSQIYIAINQAELYSTTKEQAEREALLRSITETIRSTLDLNETKLAIVNEIGNAINADRVFIVEFDSKTDQPIVLDEYSEYLSSPDELSYVGFDFSSSDVAIFSQAHKENKSLIVQNVEEFIEENDLHGTNEEKWLLESNLKTAIGIPIYSGTKVYGVLAIHYTKKIVPFTEEKMKFIRTIGDQMSIALYQARLFENQKKTAEREILTRRILEKMLSSLDINSIKNTIVTEIGKNLNVDVCFILTYDADGDYFYIDEYSEYRSSSEDKSLIGFDAQSLKVKYFVDSFRQKQEIDFVNAEEFIIENNLQGTPEESFLKEYNIKSSYRIPIVYANNILGCIVLHYNKNYTNLNESELDFIRLIATRSGIAIHQAKLYQINKIQAEREKFNKNIIEILRSTLDKNTIKHLFVRTIGKYFNADRVLFSDYDPKNKMYIPVDKYSEYLSSIDEKSFIGYDWSDERNKDYIQPLLEKRELNIPNWEEYIQANPKSPDFVSLFEDANVKSSYNFPVLYQEKIMGYFCIEFTQHVYKFSDEDISSIRSICTQAGIALYHSDLYIKAQESSASKAEFISNISNEFKAPLNTIIEFSEILEKNEFEREKQVEYLDNINKNGRQLFELTDDIINISKIESEDFRLNYESIDSGQLIMEVINSVKLIADNKNISIDTDLASVNLYADRRMLTQSLHILLNNTIKFTPLQGHITIKSELETDKLLISIESAGTGINGAEQDTFFEKFKQVDSSFGRRPQGSGLGLSIAKKLIELHNGSIHVESIKDNGARFWFVLPKANEKD